MQIPGFSEAKSSDFVYVYKTLQQTLGIIRKARSNAIVERNLKENHSWGTDTKDPAVELLANTVLATANRKLGKVLATRLCHALTSDDSELLLKE